MWMQKRCWGGMPSFLGSCQINQNGKGKGKEKKKVSRNHKGKIKSKSLQRCWGEISWLLPLELPLKLLPLRVSRGDIAQPPSTVRRHPPTRRTHTRVPVIRIQLLPRTIRIHARSRMVIGDLLREERRGSRSHGTQTRRDGQSLLLRANGRTGSHSL